jgi:protein SCO1/2
VVATLLVGVVLLASLVAAAAVRQGVMRRAARLALTPDESFGQKAPEFSLIDQDGRAVTRADLEGKLTVVDFVFTHCPFVCPQMSANMRELQAGLRGEKGVRFLSISVDPAHDTPQRLREYAVNLGADLSTWRFAAADRAALAALSEGWLSLGLAPDPSRPIRLPDGTEMQNITHSSRFVLVGPDARVITMVSGTDHAEVGALARRVRRAAGALAARDAG